jgi:5-methylcytosine-specific restriction endonuclease McrA
MPSVAELIAELNEQKAAREAKRPKDGKDKDIRDKFYASRAWKALRYKILVRDGAKCAACGRTSADGVKLAVDHIKPLFHHWDLRLEPTNLQVLCTPDCNFFGKGRHDTTSFKRGEAND